MEFSIENVDTDLKKEAIEMLLKGATMVSEPCPYCSGVRVMKDGFALCTNCGKKPEKRDHVESEATEKKSNLSEILDKKIKALSEELERETDHEKQQEILKTIDSALATLEKISDKQ